MLRGPLSNVPAVFLLRRYTDQRPRHWEVHSLPDQVRAGRRRNHFPYNNDKGRARGGPPRDSAATEATPALRHAPFASMARAVRRNGRDYLYWRRAARERERTLGRARLPVRKDLSLTENPGEDYPAGFDNREPASKRRRHQDCPSASLPLALFPEETMWF